MLLVCAFGRDVLACGRAQAQDRLLGKDKALHFGVSAGLSSAGYAVSVPLLGARSERFWLSMGSTLLVGGAKELYDATGAGTPSVWDFAWDVVGALAGAGVALLVDLAISPGNSAAPLTPDAAEGSFGAPQWGARMWRNQPPNWASLR